MSLTDAEKAKALLGSPIMLEDTCIVYPAFVKDIIAEGVDNFFTYLSIFAMTRPIIEEDSPQKEYLNSLSDFQFLLLRAQSEPKVITNAYKFFLHERQVIFSFDRQEIILGDAVEKRLIHEGNYHSLRSLVLETHWQEPPIDDVKSGDSERTRQLKEKMRLGNAKAKQMKAKEAENEDSLSFSDLIASIAAGGEGVNILNVMDFTYYALQDQMRRKSMKEAYNFNMQAALQGAKLTPEQKKHWIRPISK